MNLPDEFVFTESIGYLISMAGIRYKARIFESLKPFDITPEQWVLLNKLFEDDGISQRELAQRVEKNHPNITRILDKMEQKGVIRRSGDPHDRRAFQIYITETGVSVREKVLPVLAEVYQQSILGISEEEIEKLKTLLHRFSTNLE